MIMPLLSVFFRQPVYCILKKYIPLHLKGNMNFVFFSVFLSEGLEANSKFAWAWQN